jgi:hypothetical protein
MDLSFKYLGRHFGVHCDLPVWGQSVDIWFHCRGCLGLSCCLPSCLLTILLRWPNERKLAPFVFTPVRWFSKSLMPCEVQNLKYSFRPSLVEAPLPHKQQGTLCKAPVFRGCEYIRLNWNSHASLHMPAHLIETVIGHPGSALQSV